MSRVDFILDFETLGANAIICPAIDCSYAFIEWDRFTQNPYSLEELMIKVITKKKFDLKDQMKYGTKFTESDLNFWVDNNKIDYINPSKKDVNVVEFIDLLLTDLEKCGKIDYWWSRSNCFDPIILDRLFNYTNKSIEMRKYLKYYKVRDTRSYIDAKLYFPKDNLFIPIEDEEYWNKAMNVHNSKFDVAADILRIQAIERAESNLPMVKR